MKKILVLLLSLLLLGCFISCANETNIPKDPDISEPTIPENPDEPSTPDNPDNPDNPEEPTTPDNPEIPEEKVSVWDGESSDKDWYQEDVTEFHIESAAQLKGLSDLVSEGKTFEGKTIILDTNIDLNNKNWTPIGTILRKNGNPDNYFKGSFDGQNHLIKNLKPVDPTADNTAIGLFGVISSATIKNVIIESGEIKNTGDTAAGVVGTVLGDGNTLIQNCINKASIISKDAGAGILGRAYGSASSKIEIVDCVNEGKITGLENDLGKKGGILSINSSPVTVKSCKNKGSIDGFFVGGIASYINPNASIENCVNEGKITGCYYVDKGFAAAYGAGIVAYVTEGNSSIKECINNGEIVGIKQTNVGGIVGIMTAGESIVSSCTNTGVITGSEVSSAGGIVGSLNSNSKIENSKNEASVYGKFAGGVVGESHIGGEIINCNGGSEKISSPRFELSFKGQDFILNIGENQTAGRVLGANGGGGPGKYTKVFVADGDSYEGIGTVGICGSETTWANLEIIGGTFHGFPLAGNKTYIKLTDGEWDGKEKGKTYECGGLSEATRIPEWTAQ